MIHETDEFYNLTQLAEVCSIAMTVDGSSSKAEPVACVKKKWKLKWDCNESSSSFDVSLGSPPARDEASRSSDDLTSQNGEFTYMHKMFDKTKARQALAEGGGRAFQESPKSLSCTECNKVFSTSSNLSRHKQIHRPSNEARSCSKCGKVYVSVAAFSMHLRTHDQKCKCPICGKCFSRPWLLLGHTRIHTGERPFKCEICCKSFADKSNLRAHVQTHSSVKKYECERCSKKFALRSYLYKHGESSCFRNFAKKSSFKKEPSGLQATSKFSSDSQLPKIPTSLPLKGSKQTLTDTVKSKIREVLQENFRKSGRKQILSHENSNKVSVIRSAAEFNNQVM